LVIERATADSGRAFVGKELAEFATIDGDIATFVGVERGAEGAVINNNNGTGFCVETDSEISSIDGWYWYRMFPSRW